MGKEIPARRLQRDHVSMVRFTSREDENYGVLSGAIKALNSRIINTSRPPPVSKKPLASRDSSKFTKHVETNSDIENKLDSGVKTKGNKKNLNKGKSISPFAESKDEGEEAIPQEIHHKPTAFKGTSTRTEDSGIKASTENKSDNGVRTSQRKKKPNKGKGSVGG